MTQPNQSNPTTPTEGRDELDEILQNMANYVYNASVAAKNYGIFIGGTPMQEAKAAIKANTNAAIARTLDRLEQEVKITIYDGDDPLGKEYQAGYNSMAEATRIYQLGIMSAIEDERAKLKEVK